MFGCFSYGIPAYNQADLIPNGYVWPIIEQVDEDNNKTQKIRLLPSQELAVAFFYMQQAESTNQTLAEAALGSGGGLALGPIGLGSAAFLGQSFLGTVSTGGFSDTATKLIFHICEAKNVINYQVDITEDVLVNKYGDKIYIILPFNIAGVLSATKYSIDFSEEDLSVIGSTVNNKGISGDIFKNGQINSDLDVINNLGEDNLFVTLCVDNRSYFYRSGNGLSTNSDRQYVYDESRLWAEGNTIAMKNRLSSVVQRQNIEINNILSDSVSGDQLIDIGSYDVQISQEEISTVKVQIPIYNNNDLLSNVILINNKNLNVGDSIYITANVVDSDQRKRRQAIEHTSTLFEESGINLLTNVYPVQTKVKAWDFALYNFGVSKIFRDSDLITSYRASADAVGVTSPAVSLGVESGEEIFYSKVPLNKLTDYNAIDTVEGWRLSQLNNWDVSYIFIADYRGIFRMSYKTNEDLSFAAYDNDTVLLIPSSVLSGKEWWTKYKEENLDNDGLLDLQKNDVRFAGAVFDNCYAVNTLRYDDEKIPYFLPLAKAIQTASAPVGFCALDLYLKSHDKTGDGSAYITEGIEEYSVENYSQLTLPQSNGTTYNIDMSRSFFNIGKQSSYTGQRDGIVGGYSAAACDDLEDGSLTYRNPSDFRNEFSMLGILQTAGGFPDLVAYWMLYLPFYSDGYAMQTRVFIEGFRTSGSVEDMSMCLVQPLDVLNPVIAASNTYTADKSFVFFTDYQQDSISFSVIDYGFYSGYSGDLTNDFSLNNTTAFDVDINEENTNKFFPCGYNRVFGDNPSLSEGRHITVERNFLCDLTNPLNTIDNYNNFYTAIKTKATKISDGLFSVATQSGIMIKNIKLHLTLDESKLDDSFDSSFVIVFDAEDKRLIDNIIIPVSESEYSIDLEIDYYESSGGIDIYCSDIVEKMDVEYIYISKEDFDTYKINSISMSSVINNNNHIFVFFETEQQNIGMLHSTDEGKNWYDYYDLIRLTEGEIASNPYAVYNPKSNEINLFYVLNDKFLMHKVIYGRFINCDDSRVYMSRHKSWVFESDDSDLELFSEEGKNMRYNAGDFVSGNKNDNFYIDMKIINAKRNRYNNENDNSEGFSEKSIRFSYPDIESAISGDIFEHRNDLDQPFVSGDLYFAFIGFNGLLCVFYVIDGVLTIKLQGHNPGIWRYAAQNLIFHLNTTEDLNEENDDYTFDGSLMTSFSGVVNHESNDLILLYIYDEILFCRRFNVIKLFEVITDLLSVLGDISDSEETSGNSREEIDNDEGGLSSFWESAVDSITAAASGIAGMVKDTFDGVLKSIEIQNKKCFIVDYFYPAKPNLPVFLVGSMSDNIKNSIVSGDSLIIYNYNTDVNDFNNMAINKYSKNNGVFLKNGIFKFFYFNEDNILLSGNLSGEVTSLDIFFVNKEWDSNNNG